MDLRQYIMLRCSNVTPFQPILQGFAKTALQRCIQLRQPLCHSRRFLTLPAHSCMHTRPEARWRNSLTCPTPFPNV